MPWPGRCCSSCGWSASAAGRCVPDLRGSAGVPAAPWLATAADSSSQPKLIEADRLALGAVGGPQHDALRPPPRPRSGSAPSPSPRPRRSRASRALGRQRDQQLVVLAAPGGQVVGVGPAAAASSRRPPAAAGAPARSPAGRRSPPRGDAASPPRPSLRSIIALAPRCREGPAGGESRMRLQLAAAQRLGDLCPDGVRQLGAIQQQQPRRRAPELAGDGQRRRPGWRPTRRTSCSAESAWPTTVIATQSTGARVTSPPSTATSCSAATSARPSPSSRQPASSRSSGTPSCT